MPKKVRIFEVDRKENFIELLIYPKILLAILKKSLNKITQSSREYRTTISFSPTINDTNVVAHIVYKDTYGNLITNITRTIFDKYLRNKKIEIILKHKYIVKKISNSYADLTGEEGELFALFNSLGLLEIGMVNGNLVEILNIMSDEILIKIIEENKDGQLSIF
jgi:S-adenosylmethionine hydrolase